MDHCTIKSVDRLYSNLFKIIINFTERNVRPDCHGSIVCIYKKLEAASRSVTLEGDQQMDKRMFNRHGKRSGESDMITSVQNEEPFQVCYSNT